jgi:hypothetical protein
LCAGLAHFPYAANFGHSVFSNSEMSLKRSVLGLSVDFHAQLTRIFVGK